MKVLTLQQPWASLVVMGAKRIETRSWNTKYRGPLLIHSSAGCSDRLYKTLCKTKPFNRYTPDFDQLPMGAIIGMVELEATQSTELLKLVSRSGMVVDMPYLLSVQDWDEELQFGNYDPGRWGWILSNPVHFAQPIPAKGALGLWDYDGPLPDLSTAKP